MIFYFFDHNGNRLFQRSDAIEFEHYVESMSFKGVFPFAGHIPEACMMVGWKDDDDLWELHEISTVQLDAFGENVEISGNHIGVTELGASIADKVKLKNVTVKNALETIIGLQSQWQLGTLPAAAEDDPIRKQRYRVIKSATMYTQQATNTKKLATYSKGKFLTVVAQPSATWWQMEGSDGRIGWINNPSTYVTRDGNAGDEDRKFTCDEKFVPLWELLSKVQDECGWIIVPRVEIGDSGITGRYIDVRTDNPDYHGVRLTCHTNISEGFIKYDVSGLYTAMYGVGKNDKDFGSIVWTIAGGYPVDKPRNQKYVALPDALAAYGHNGVHRYGVCNIADEDNAAELLAKTYDALVAASVPKITIDGTIADLYQLGYGGESMRLYDKVQVILEPIGRRTELRITGLKRDLVQPERTQPIIGALDDTDMVKNVVSAAGGTTSIKSWQISSGAVGNDAIADASVSSEKIITGAVVAETISADAVVSEKIAAGAVTADKIGAGSVTAEKLAAGAVDAGALSAITAKIQSLTAGDIDTDTLAAALARFGVITAGNATFDRATVGHLVSKFFNLDGSGSFEDVYIYNLMLTYGQFASAIVEKLALKGDDGHYYKIEITGGQLAPQLIPDDEIDEETGMTTDGTRSLIDSALSQLDMTSGPTIKGLVGVINRIYASVIDTDTLFAREAFIEKLRTTKIVGDQTIEMYVAGEVKKTGRIFRQETMPDGSQGAKADDLWINPLTGETFQATAIDLAFEYDPETGELTAEGISADTLELEDGYLTSTGITISIDENGFVTSAVSWVRVREDEVDRALADLNVQQQIIQIKQDGLYIYPASLDADGQKVVDMTGYYNKMDNASYNIQHTSEAHPSVSFRPKKWIFGGQVYFITADGKSTARRAITAEDYD